MEELLSVLMDVLGEVLLELFGQLLVDVGLSSLAAVAERPGERNPYLALLGHSLLGALTGAVTLAFLPRLVIRPSLRVANLVLTPILAGLLMSRVGQLRERRRRRSRTSLERFGCGAAFALAFALVRFFAAR